MQGVTNLIKGAAVAKDDDKVVKAFQVACRESTGGVSKWTVGIRNPTGSIYRGCVLYGLDAMTYFANKMESLGFDDERAKEEDRDSGFDSVFSKL